MRAAEEMVPRPRGRPKGHPKTGGRAKGTPNRMTALLKDAIIEAARRAGNTIDPQSKDGLISYLEFQAQQNPGPFLNLLGKVLPVQLVEQNNRPLSDTVARIEIVGVEYSKVIDADYKRCEDDKP